MAIFIVPINPQITLKSNFDSRMNLFSNKQVYTIYQHMPFRLRFLLIICHEFVTNGNVAIVRNCDIAKNLSIIYTFMTLVKIYIQQHSNSTELTSIHNVNKEMNNVSTQAEGKKIFCVPSYNIRKLPLNTCHAR